VCVAPATLLEYSNGGAKVAGTGGIIIGYHVGCFGLDDFGARGGKNAISSQTVSAKKRRITD
jgi:hypothetical protein